MPAPQPDEPPTDIATDRAMLRRAALAGWRGLGHVEPNPAVGCVIASPHGTVLGIGHHERFGGPHAEARALERCRELGRDPRGATAYVTLEPCNAHGRNPPCSEALIAAGIARVVYARGDVNPLKSGGAARLRAAGVRVDHVSCALASALAAPWARRFEHGLPWVIAKWAQTIDGRIATSSGDSKWISCPASRRRVHALRARVDAIITGVGTVLADDPLLTARGVPVRRIARRVVIDPRLRLPSGCALLRSLDRAPLTLVTSQTTDRARVARAAELSAMGVEVLALPPASAGQLPIIDVLRYLVSTHDASNVLVEAGPRLTGSMLRERHINELLVFIAPTILGDPRGLPPGDTGPATTIAAAHRFTLTRARTLSGDVVLRYIEARTS